MTWQSHLNSKKKGFYPIVHSSLVLYSTQIVHNSIAKNLPPYLALRAAGVVPMCAYRPHESTNYTHTNINMGLRK
jgi:hypothetical protein